MSSIIEDGKKIIQESIGAVLPDAAVRRTLSGTGLCGRIVLVAIGKAAWQMAKAAYDELGGRVSAGIVITKYDHVKGPIGSLELVEAGHPVPDENSFAGARRALELVSGLGAGDTVLFLVSGGGSALFEAPLVPPEELQEITGQMLAKGMDIVSMNMIRKRLSAVKGGKFAQACAPARVVQIVLSDILGDPLDMIASGPAAPDTSTCVDALAAAERFGLELSADAEALLHTETPKQLDNVESFVNGSVRELCAAAAKAAEELGYEPVYLTDLLCCEARDAGSFLGSVAVSHARDGKNLAFIAGGETVVHLTGKGKGGRNQELALAAAEQISGHENIAVLSVGSDGTDGPTDAAGGIVTGKTRALLEAAGLDIQAVLKENDAYNALKAVDALVITGATGTNVNDVSVALVRAQV
ncbi:MAG: glycerate kinase [Firmicutes bacterium]|nr:glycerate kinase [Bacillota bacterium]